MESFLKISSQKDTMSDDDDGMAIPKGKSTSPHFMPNKLVYVLFDVETGGEYFETIQGIIQAKF